MADVLTAPARDIRRVRLPSGLVPLGALAATTRSHPFVPDGWTGTSCLLCFGWCTDPRHTGHQPLPTVTVT
jgi:hypothetical protein